MYLKEIQFRNLVHSSQEDFFTGSLSCLVGASVGEAKLPHLGVNKGSKVTDPDFSEKFPLGANWVNSAHYGRKST